jgi:calcineurin-like phosphoesterase family protein
MNEMLVKNWNETVAPDDTVVHCGDVALGPIRDSLKYISRLNGYKVLVIGNHDRNFRLGKRSGGLEPQEWDKEYLDAGFDEVHINYGAVLDGVMFAVSHFPYDGDSHDGDRFENARLVDDGTPLIHGHTHSHGHPVSFSAKWTPQIHVGVDAHGYRPVSEDRVLALFNLTQSRG